jgi:hypothetical protein
MPAAVDRVPVGYVITAKHGLLRSRKTEPCSGVLETRMDSGLYSQVPQEPEMEIRLGL